MNVLIYLNDGSVARKGSEEYEKVIDLLKYRVNYDAEANHSDIEVFGKLESDFQLVHYRSRETLLAYYDGVWYDTAESLDEFENKYC